MHHGYLVIYCSSSSSSVQVVLLSCFRRIKRVRHPWGTKCVHPHSWCRSRSPGQSMKGDSGLSVDRTVHWSCPPSSLPASLARVRHLELPGARSVRAYKRSDGATFKDCGNFHNQHRVSELSQTCRGLSRTIANACFSQCAFNTCPCRKSFSPDDLFPAVMWFDKFQCPPRPGQKPCGYSVHTCAG